MTWLKVNSIGDKATIVVKNVGLVNGRLGEQLMFKSTKDEDIYVPKAIGYMWLEKCGYGDEKTINFDTVIGALLCFERVPAPDPTARPHWQITRLNVITAATNYDNGGERVLNDHLPPASAGAPTPESEKSQRRDEIAKAFAWACEVSSAVQYGLAATKKGHAKPTAESIQAGATTLMLRAERMGAI